MEAGYFLAFTAGIAGGFGHCIGMCGPLVASYSLSTPTGTTQSLANRSFPHFLYNLGRITTYGIIGGIMGLSGSFVNVAGRLAGIQNFVAIIAGIMMVAMGVSVVTRKGTAAWFEKYTSPVLRLAHHARSLPSSFRYYPLGLLLGLLPCGLSYTIFIASAGTGGLVPGMITTLLFGLGTLPALLVFGTVITSLSASLRGTIYRISGTIVIIMGIYFLYKGIKLYVDL